MKPIQIDFLYDCLQTQDIIIYCASGLGSWYSIQFMIHNR